MVILLNAILLGLQALAFMTHINIVGWGNASVGFQAEMALFLPINLGVFTCFFIVGFLYYLLFFLVVNFIYGKGANYAGYAGGKDVKSFPIVMYAMAPTLLVGVINVLVTLVAVPTYDVTIPGRSGSQILIDGQLFTDVLRGMFVGSSGEPRPVWVAIEVLNIVVYLTWIPVLVTIGLREVFEVSTARMYLSAMVCSIIIVAVFFATRVTITGL